MEEKIISVQELGRFLKTKKYSTYQCYWEEVVDTLGRRINYMVRHFYDNMRIDELGDIELHSAMNVLIINDYFIDKITHIEESHAIIIYMKNGTRFDINYMNI